MPTKFFNFTQQDNKVEIDVFDQIIGWDVWSGEFKAELDKAKSANEIVLNLNSPGGVITEGLAMYAMLREVSDKLTIKVYGIAASIASVIALAGDKLVMSEGSFLMIHNPFVDGYIKAEADDMRSLADALDTMKKQILNIYKRKWNGSDEALIEAMDKETFFTAQEAVEVGFAEVAEEAEYKQVACFDDLHTKNTEGKAIYMASISEKQENIEENNENTSVTDENQLFLTLNDLVSAVDTLTKEVQELKNSSKSQKVEEEVMDSGEDNGLSSDAETSSDFFNAVLESFISVKKEPSEGEE